MKVVVTEMPKEPKDCLFSAMDIRGRFYFCTLRGYIPEADEHSTGYKPKCICKNCDNCEHLEVQNG